MRAAVLTDGTTVEADVVVVGIGVSVNTGWLEGSGLTLDDGVVCDETLLAAPGVVAAGDVARYPSRRFGGPLRVEHWEHAMQGGEAAGARILAELRGGEPASFDPVPWFWSDQYDRKIQLAGRPAPGDEHAVVHGSVDEFRFVTLYGRAGRLVGVLGVNRPRHVIQLRGLVEADADWDAALGAGRRAVTPVSSPDELVDVLDDEGRIVGAVTRSRMRAERTRHRTVFVAVTNVAGELLVHRRAPWKDVWPGHWDIAVGGVVTAGEAWEAAAGRELAEELGVVAELTYLGEDGYADEQVRELARVYQARCEGPFRFDDGEVVEVAWVPLDHLRDWLAGRDHCPDSVAVVLPRLDAP